MFSRHIGSPAVYVSTDYEYHARKCSGGSVDPKKIIGAMLGGAVILWLVGTMVSNQRRSEAAESTPPPPPDKWQTSESRSQMDDSKTVVLSLDSDDQIQGPLGAVRPSLVVRCQEKKTAAYVAIGMAASVEAYGEFSTAPEDSHTVRTRLDDANARTEYWYESTDHKALFAARDSIEFAKELTGANVFAFQFTPFDGSPQVARFDLRGLDVHLHKVAEACGWAY